MIYYVFKLDQYYSDSQKHYRFAEGLFEYTRLRKKKTIESVEVNYSAYRVEKFRKDVRNDNINKIIEFFGYKKIEEDDIIIYETLFTKVYYCCYYGNIKSYDFYLKQIEDLMQKKDIVYPILVLFKVFLYYNKLHDIDECRKVIKKELQYLYAFYKNEYFSGDLKYLCLLMLFYFDKTNNEKIKDLLFAKKFCYKEPKLSWIYYSIKAQKAYIAHNDLEAIMYIEILIKEYKNNNNMNKYLATINNLSYSYNLEYEYPASLSYTNNVIEYLFSAPEYERWIKYILVHFLYSKLMLKQYDEIVDFFNIVAFEEKYLLNVSATVFLICAYVTKNNLFLEKILKMCQGKGFSTVEDIKKYIKTKDKSILESLDDAPYVSRLKKFIIENLKRP